MSTHSPTPQIHPRPSALTPSQINDILPSAHCYNPKSKIQNPPSAIIGVNGAAAHRVEVGDKVIITAFVLTDEPIEPQMILVDENNLYTIHIPFAKRD